MRKQSRRTSRLENARDSDRFQPIAAPSARRAGWTHGEPDARIASRMRAQRAGCAGWRAGCVSFRVGDFKTSAPARKSAHRRAKVRTRAHFCARGKSMHSNDLTSISRTFARFSTCARKKTAVPRRTMRIPSQKSIEQGDARRAWPRACRASARGEWNAITSVTCSRAGSRNTREVWFSRDASALPKTACHASARRTTRTRNSASSKRTMRRQFSQRADPKRELGRARKNPLPRTSGRKRQFLQPLSLAGRGRERVSRVASSSIGKQIPRIAPAFNPSPSTPVSGWLSLPAHVSLVFDGYGLRLYASLHRPTR
jgi:hypothetical protein